MATSVELRITVPGFDPTFDVWAVPVRVTPGAVHHYDVGFGFDGKLLAVAWGIEHRGEFGLLCQLHGEEVPREISSEAKRALAAHFKTEWAR